MSGGTSSGHSRISVAGLGNVLLGDDGFGPLVIELFRCEYECRQDVEIIDLGTAGLDLTPYLYGRDLVLIVDAVHADEKPGTLCIYRDTDLLAGRGQLRVSAHDPGLQESLAQLKLVGQAPSELIIIGVVPACCECGNDISSTVLGACSVAVNSIARLLMERDVDCHRRHAALEPNVWWRGFHRSEVASPRSDLQNHDEYFSSLRARQLAGIIGE
jgi:hydrogenase maturation protease